MWRRRKWLNRSVWIARNPSPEQCYDLMQTSILKLSTIASTDCISRSAHQPEVIQAVMR
jgi:hypothetical protein